MWIFQHKVLALLKLGVEEEQTNAEHVKTEPHPGLRAQRIPGRGMVY